MDKNAKRVKEILIKTIESFSKINDYDIIKNKIRAIPDFPKKGIIFRDVTTLLKDKEGVKKTVNILYNKYKDRNIHLVVGIESRGFILGAILAEKLGVGFIPIRKKGKLPAETECEEYDLEYGKDAIEIHKDAIQPGQSVLLVDDLIATGGTAVASCKLIEKLGGKVEECVFIVELPELKGREKLENNGYRVFSVVSFEGE
jgi:adenine phosphoribosyltransferase